MFPTNGSVSRVWLDLTEQDARWGSAAVSGVSAFDGDRFWLNPVGGNTPSGQALYGFPLNGSAATVIPYGAQDNVNHAFFSRAQRGLLVVGNHGDPSVMYIARVSPVAPIFTPIFTWSLTGGEEDFGLYDVSPDGTKLLAVLTDKNGENPVLSVVDLVLLKELRRIPIKGFGSADTVCDVNWCNV